MNWVEIFQGIIKVLCMMKMILRWIFSSTADDHALAWCCL